MRLLVTGGRAYHSLTTAWGALDRLHAAISITLLIEGGAAGADRLANCWAANNGVPIESYSADWKRWGRSAGPRRNITMLTLGKPDAVLAFPGGRGTADLQAKAVRAGVPVVYGEALTDKDISDLQHALAAHK